MREVREYDATLRMVPSGWRSCIEAVAHLEWLRAVLAHEQAAARVLVLGERPVRPVAGRAHEVGNGVCFLGLCGRAARHDRLAPRLTIALFASRRPCSRHPDLGDENDVRSMLHEELSHGRRV